MRWFFVYCVSSVLFGFAAWGQTPVTTDSRIKVFVYNENDVYNLLTYYGYQSNVEFGDDEKIETVSIGDRVGWQLVPANRRLFIRALSDNLHTNMTVVTNLRAYQFDLRSANPANLAREELVYVARFFYPDDRKNAQPVTQKPVPNPTAPAMISAPVAAAPTPAVTAAPLTAIANTIPAALSVPPSPAPTAPSTAAQPPVKSLTAPNYNYNYTYTGSGYLVPMGMFDDGRYTYFQFVQGAAVPEIFAVDTAGQASAVKVHTHQGYSVIDRVAPQFVLRLGNDKANLFNESYGKK